MRHASGTSVSSSSRSMRTRADTGFGEGLAGPARLDQGLGEGELQGRVHRQVRHLDESCQALGQERDAALQIAAKRVELPGQRPGEKLVRDKRVPGGQHPPRGERLRRPVEIARPKGDRRRPEQSRAQRDGMADRIGLPHHPVNGRGRLVGQALHPQRAGDGAVGQHALVDAEADNLGPALEREVAQGVPAAQSRLGLTPHEVIENAHHPVAGREASIGERVPDAGAAALRIGHRGLEVREAEREDVQALQQPDLVGEILLGLRQVQGLVERGPRILAVAPGVAQGDASCRLQLEPQLRPERGEFLCPERPPGPVDAFGQQRQVKEQGRGTGHEPDRQLRVAARPERPDQRGTDVADLEGEGRHPVATVPRPARRPRALEQACVAGDVPAGDARFLARRPELPEGELARHLEQAVAGAALGGLQHEMGLVGQRTEDLQVIGPVRAVVEDRQGRIQREVAGEDRQGPQRAGLGLG